MSQQVPIDFNAAERRAERGMRRAADRACRKVDPLWVETALTFLARFAREQGSDAFTIEQARSSMASQVVAPPDLRAWGQVTRRALLRHVIVPAGVARAASSNNSFKTTYRAGEGSA